jgi:hypothetical protein
MMMKSRRMRWLGSVSNMRDMINVLGVIVRKHEGKRLLTEPRRRWENNIKMDVRRMSCIFVWTEFNWPDSEHF